MGTSANGTISAPGLMHSASSFSLKELGGLKRELILRDRALPYRPFKIGGKFRVETSWYAGNPIATQQPLGSEEGSTTFTGYWKDRFIAAPNVTSAAALINGVGVTDAFDLCQQLDDFRRQGQQIDFRWDAVVRVGTITNFEMTWHRREDVEWSLTIDWASQGEEDVGAPAVKVSIGAVLDSVQADVGAVRNAAGPLGIINGVKAQTPANLLAAVRQDASDLYNAAAAVIAAGAEFVQQVSDAIQNLYAAVDALSDLATQVGNAISDAITAIQKAAALLSYVIQQARVIEQSINLTPAPYFYNAALPPPAPPGPGSIPASSLTAGQLLAAESAARQLRKRIRDARTNAALQRAQAAASASPPELITVFAARDGDDLRKVATRFYGSQTPWRDLATYNNLRSGKLTAGQIVYVPRDPPAASAKGIPLSNAQVGNATTQTPGSAR